MSIISGGRKKKEPGFQIALSSPGPRRKGGGGGGLGLVPSVFVKHVPQVTQFTLMERLFVFWGETFAYMAVVL